MKEKFPLVKFFSPFENALLFNNIKKAEAMIKACNKIKKRWQMLSPLLRFNI